MSSNHKQTIALSQKPHSRIQAGYRTSIAFALIGLIGFVLPCQAKTLHMPANLGRIAPPWAETMLFGPDYIPSMSYDDVEVPISSFAIAVQSTNAVCASDADEVAEGYRVGGNLTLTDALVLDDSNISINFTEGSADYPYFVELEVFLGDLDFASVSDLDISAYCVEMDQSVTGTIEDAQLTIRLAPPYPDANHFSLYETELDYSDINVNFALTSDLRTGLTIALAWVLGCSAFPFPANLACANDIVNDIEDAIVDYVNDKISQNAHTYINQAVSDAVFSSSEIEQMVDALDTWFWFNAILQAPSVQSLGDSESTNIYTTTYGSSAACGGGECAVYKLYCPN